MEPEDAPELFALTDRNRKHLREWLPWLDLAKTEAETARFMVDVQQQMLRNEGLQLVIRVENRAAGVIGLHRIDRFHKNTSIGYWLAEEFQGRGLMTRSCRALVDYVFEKMDLHRVEIRCAAQNRKSRAIPVRLGFREEGILRQSEWLYDHFVDLVVYGLLFGEWRKREGVR